MDADRVAGYQARQRRLNKDAYSRVAARLNSPTEYDAVNVAEVRALSDVELSNEFKAGKPRIRWEVFLELVERDHLRLQMTQREVENLLGAPDHYQSRGTRRRADYGALHTVGGLDLHYDQGLVIGIEAWFEGEAAGPGIEIWHDGKPKMWLHE